MEEFKMNHSMTRKDKDITYVTKSKDNPVSREDLDDEELLMLSKKFTKMMNKQFKENFGHQTPAKTSRKKLFQHQVGQGFIQTKTNIKHMFQRKSSEKASLMMLFVVNVGGKEILSQNAPLPYKRKRKI